MHTVTVSTHLSATPEQVWSTVGDPSSISAWHPVIATSPVEDTRRACTLVDGVEVAEQIDEIDNANRSYSYRIIESPLPIDSYRSTIKVVDADDGCDVEWTSSFEVTDGPVEDAVAIIKGVYNAGMAALREQYKS